MLLVKIGLSIILSVICKEQECQSFLKNRNLNCVIYNQTVLYRPQVFMTVADSPFNHQHWRRRNTFCARVSEKIKDTRPFDIRHLNTVIYNQTTLWIDNTSILLHDLQEKHCQQNGTLQQLPNVHLQGIRTPSFGLWSRGVMKLELEWSLWSRTNNHQLLTTLELMNISSWPG